MLPSDLCPLGAGALDTMCRTCVAGRGPHGLGGCAMATAAKTDFKIQFEKSGGLPGVHGAVAVVSEPCGWAAL